MAIAATRATRRMVKLRDAAMVTCIILGVVMKSMGREANRERVVSCDGCMKNELRTCLPLIHHIIKMIIQRLSPYDSY